MKTSLAIKVLVLLTLTTATVAQAESYSDNPEYHAYQMESVSYVGEIASMSKELDAIYLKISDLNDEVGMNMDDSHGYLKALGEQLYLTDTLKKNFENATGDLSKKSIQSQFTTLVAAKKILKQARENLNAAKSLSEDSKQYR